MNVGYFVGTAVGCGVGAGDGDAVGALVGHASVLQLAELPPEHWLPPWAGAGFVHVRVFVPPPHPTEHEVQPVQPPLHGTSCHAADCCCGCPPFLQPFTESRCRYLVPACEHEPPVWPCQPLQLSQHDVGQIVHVSPWVCPCEPRQLFCEPRVRVRVLVPLVVQLPWQELQLP